MLSGSPFTCAQATIIYQSATLGPVDITKEQVFTGDVPASNVVHFNFVGARFEVKETSLTTRIGGHFLGGFDNDTFFGALVRLTDPIDFPDSVDLSTPDVLGSTLMLFPEPSSEVFGNLSVELTPGWYAVMFGSGLFGATGRGAVVRNGTDRGSPDYILCQPSNGWFNLADLGFPGFGNQRFVIEGHVTPEPTSVGLVVAASCVLLSRRVRRPRRNMVQFSTSQAAECFSAEPKSI
jgi:hypothetical protein